LDGWLKALQHLLRSGFHVLLDFLRLILTTCRSRSAVEAENLFLRKQLALFSRAQNQAPPGRRFHPPAYELSKLVVRLAQRIGCD
jgi:hypothetical protein